MKKGLCSLSMHMGCIINFLGQRGPAATPSNLSGLAAFCFACHSFGFHHQKIIIIMVSWSPLIIALHWQKLYLIVKQSQYCNTTLYASVDVAQS